MYEDELARVGSSIEKLHTDGVLISRPIIMFGVSENTRQMIKMIINLGYTATCVIDNDLTRKGSNCYQVPVKPVVYLSETELREGIFFIYSYFWREMKTQLLNMGIDDSRVFSFFLPDLTLEEQFERAEKGMNMCELFREEIGDFPIFLCPYTGTGDIYLIGTFWKQYLEKQRVNDYIFIVVSKACARVCDLFNIKNVRQVTQVESSYIVEFYKLCGEKTDIKILNDSWWELRANPLQRFRGFKGLYFTQIFRKFVFNLDDNVKPVHPVLRNADDELNKVFRDNKIAEGKTIVLSPYSNTLSDLPSSFWTSVVNKLREKGFDICTNCGRDEKPIEGTSGVFVPLNIAPQFIAKAGYFIGVRSGFCDCISAADAKLVILYDRRNRFFNCSAYEYFNLKDMEFRDDAIELEYDTDHINELVDTILEQF